MKLGIIGLPNVGKSTLFNALTNGHAECANYPFCTIEPNIGIVTVPDERLNVLAKLFNSSKITPATVEFKDIAGLVKNASQGEGLGNKFLADIREVNALVQVVRCFDDKEIIHVSQKIDPIDDIETINLELICSDLELVTKLLTKYKNNNKITAEKFNFLERLKTHLEKGIRANNFTLQTKNEKVFFTELNLLSAKPMLYVANISENELQKTENELKLVNMVKEYAFKEKSECVVICAKIEMELIKLLPEEQKSFLSLYNLKESGLERLIKKSYSLLGYLNYLTAGSSEVRAWTITKGTKAPQAAGKIHSDLERGFIKAEIVSYPDLVAAGNFSKAKEQGKMRFEGREYIVQPDDVITFKFNV